MKGSFVRILQRCIIMLKGKLSIVQLWLKYTSIICTVCTQVAIILHSMFVHIQNYIITETKLIIPEGQCVEKYSCINGGWSGKTFVRKNS
jgi:hypothetical protein